MLKLTLEAPHIHGLVNELKIAVHALEHGLLTPESRAVTSEAAQRARAVELNPEAGSEAAPAPKAEEPAPTKKAPAAKKPVAAKPKPAPKAKAPEPQEPEAEEDVGAGEESEATGEEEEFDPALGGEAGEEEQTVTLEDLLQAFPVFVNSHKKADDDELGKKRGLRAAKAILEEVGVAKVSEIKKKDWASVYEKLTAQVG